MDTNNSITDIIRNLCKRLQLVNTGAINVCYA